MAYHDGASLSDGQAVAARTRIVLRPIGSPLPLGLLALAPAGLLYSCLQIGAFSLSEGKTVALIVLVFAVPLQLIAAVLCFLARDAIGGCALGIFGGAWLASGAVLLSTPPGSASPAFGVFLVMIGVAMVIVVASAAGSKAGPAVVMVAGSARFMLAGLYELTARVGVEHAAAIVGFAFPAAALYSALATLLEDVHGESKLPIGRRGRAAAAIEGGFADQLVGLEREAGVRQQL